MAIVSPLADCQVITLLSCFVAVVIGQVSGSGQKMSSVFAGLSSDQSTSQNAISIQFARRQTANVFSGFRPGELRERHIATTAIAFAARGHEVPGLVRATVSLTGQVVEGDVHWCGRVEICTAVDTAK
jgi:hypothetical protein